MNKNDNFEFKIDRIRSPYSKPEMVESLKLYAETHEIETFGMREYDAWENRLATSETIRLHFKGWGKALQEAGFRASRSNNLDLKEMIKAFKNCWRENQSGAFTKAT